MRVEYLCKIAPALPLLGVVLHRAPANQRKQEERVARVVGAHRARHDPSKGIGQREGRAVGHDQGFVEHRDGRQRVPEGPARRAAREAVPEEAPEPLHEGRLPLRRQAQGHVAEDAS